jgi:hypothetical protein
VPAEDFQAWVSEVQSKSGGLDAATFAQLAQPSRAKGTATYGQVSVGLFDAIVAGSSQQVSAPLVRH